MNFVFISPNFPHTYWNFCDRLKKNGVNVLGIGDEAYDNLEQGLRNSLTEYYKVDSLENYDSVYRAVAFFAFKYGKIDWLESMNEYWLQQDAQLRTDFNITTGVQNGQINFIKEKSLMKIKYKEAGVPTARQSMVTDLAAAKEFVAQVGYPVIVKPNIGVGANDTYKLRSDDELETFFYKLPEIPYVMEEFVVGDLVSYEAILDSNCEPLFENHTEWPIPVMDVVNKDLDLKYYVCSDVPEKLAEAGRKTVKAFGVKNRYVHLEFFRLTKDKEGLGKKGDYVGLEVNMRPAGGYTPDMINFAHSIDTYQIWADMITTDKRMVPAAEKEKFCVYAGRRNHYSYVHSHDDIMCKYGDVIMMQEDMPEVNWPQMGNYMYTAVLPDLEAVQTFLKYVQERSNWDGQH